VRPGDDLLVSTEVPESSVWRRTRGMAGRLEARRLRRDELRVARAARAVGGYDRDEMEAYRSAGIAAHWLPITLPPVEAVDVERTPPRLVLLGNRTWRPNADAALAMVRLWPTISAGIPDAELLLVGPTPAGAPDATLPPGVTDLGFVDDVDLVLSGCRALVAPIAVGGGVRVKLLEAAARGLPVVATTEAVGTLEASVGISPARDEDDLVARCRAHLLDAVRAAADGSALHTENARRWSDRVGQDAVLGWLSA
jgi:glycosyltransferase involved in cell wall biosynthesis